jgi:hypothetical protein
MIMPPPAALFKDGTITELGCMAHARHQFLDLAQANGSAPSPLAPGATPDRSERSRTSRRACANAGGPNTPTPDRRRYHAWLVQTRAAVPDGTGTAKALTTPYTAGRR